MKRCIEILFVLTLFSQIVQGQSKSDNVLKTVETIHAFSSPTEMDTFMLTLKGNSIVDGEICFEIINYKGLKIYSETFKSTKLIGYGLLEFENPTEKDKVEFIKKRMNEFFAESNFLQPAIPKTEEFDEDYYEKETFYKIQNNFNSIGFSYVIGEEDIRQITIVDNKVIIYWNCC